MLEFSYLAQPQDDDTSQITDQLQFEECSCYLTIYVSEDINFKSRISNGENALEIVALQEQKQEKEEDRNLWFQNTSPSTSYEGIKGV